MSKPHKWAKEIKAWADGQEIENRHLDENGNWCEWGYWSSNTDVTVNFLTHDGIEYRIKPQPKEPQYLYVYKVNKNSIELCDEYSAYTKDLYIGKIKLETEDGGD